MRLHHAHEPRVIGRFTVPGQPNLVEVDCPGPIRLFIANYGGTARATRPGRRTLLLAILALVSGWPCGAIQIVEGDRSARACHLPYETACWRFSISQAGCLVAIAISTAAIAIGVDIETRDRVARNVSYTDPWLSADEMTALVEQQPAEQIEQLAFSWLLREALGKARGTGLAFPLDRLKLLGPDRVTLLPASCMARRRSQWSFLLLRHEQALIALAWMGRTHATDVFAASGQTRAGQCNSTLHEVA